MAKDVLYFDDILNDGFKQQTIELNDDYEGRAVATVIRRLSDTVSDKAILYIHGFNDYFFQREMGRRFNEYGYNFYALDLRKYGRSHLANQKFNDIKNLKAYYEEITVALNIIHNENNKKVILFGHSTGGLILTLFAKDNIGSKLFDGLILNSPFFEFNKSRLVKKIIPLASSIGKIFPKLKIPGGFAKEYGENLHKSYSGEWEYDLAWKPNIAPKVNLGWIRAIHKAQMELKKLFKIEQPVLVLHSSLSATDVKDKEQIQTRDAILNVKDIELIAQNIKGDVEAIAIEGGLHDLVLSKKPVREKVYNTIFDWLKRNNL